MYKLYQISDDKKQHLNFRKVLRTEVIEPHTCSWADLHEFRSKITKSCQTLLDKADAEKRALADDENSAFDLATELLDNIAQEFENREDRGTKDPIKQEKFVPWGGNATYAGDGSGRITYLTPSHAKGTEREYRNLFHADNPNVSLSNDGFRNIGEFFHAVAGIQKDSRLRALPVETRTNVAGTGVYGGFAIPDAYSEQLLNAALISGEVFRPRCLVLPMTGPTVACPRWDVTDRSSGEIFGLKLQWVGENSENSVQTAKIKLMNLQAHKGMIYFELSRELMQDSASFSAQISAMIPKVIAAGLDAAFIKADGVAKPLGVVNSNSVIKVTRNTGSAILWTDIKAMWGKLHSECYANATWILSSGTIPMLLGLKDDANNAIFLPGINGSVADGVPMKLMGRPIVFCESSPTLGSIGDIVLADLGQYAIGIRQDISLETSNAAGWSRDVQSYRMSFRCDGLPIWSDKITQENGDTVSWAVALTT